MTKGEVADNGRMVDIRELNPRIRHTLILQLVEHLEPHATLQFVVDHEPKPLRFQLEATYGKHVLWTYLETGPDTWRVRLRRNVEGGGYARQD